RPAGAEARQPQCQYGLILTGVVALESNVPLEETIVVDLQNDEIKIDGNNAMAWSESLQLTVERTAKTLVGSAASGEGLVNVYRGTGRIRICPTARTRSFAASTHS
uniref:AIM24 family protein n=1 Tax=Tractidigestivibacter sp. TaxID=2847320 RepID=UPI003FD6D4C0